MIHRVLAPFSTLYSHFGHVLFRRYDANADGVWNNDESGYTGGEMTIRLIDDNGDVSKETTSDPATGNFKLENVVPGTYEIEFSDPNNAGIGFTAQNAGQDDAKDSDVDPVTGRAPLEVVSGDVVTQVAAGVASLPSIGPNIVFQDDDADGILDPNEVGLEGVAVVLYDENGTQADVTITDSDGLYSFTNLDPDTPYYISINNDPSFVFSPSIVGGNQITPNDNTPYNNGEHCFVNAFSQSFLLSSFFTIIISSGLTPFPISPSSFSPDHPGSWRARYQPRCGHV